MHQDDVYQLLEYVAANGYEVKMATSSGVSVINIFHRATHRESVFGYDAKSKCDVVGAILERFCTTQQAMNLAETRALSLYGCGMRHASVR